MRIPGLKKTKLLVPWLKSRFTDGALILGYHRVAEIAWDPYSMCVTPQHFAEQLEVLHEIAFPMRLTELVEALGNNNLPRRAVALTIDDGYADALYQAKPLLKRYQIPATVFAATGYLGREFWWDKLQRMLFSPRSLPDKLSLPINGDIYEWQSNNAAWPKSEKEISVARQHLFLSIYQRLLPLTAAEQQEVLVQLESWGAAKLDDQPDCRALTPGELFDLAAGDLVEIGAHTVSHPLLAELPATAQRAEIWHSKARLEGILEHPVSSFSYPNGSLSEETLTIVQDIEFNCACTSFPNVAWRECDRFQLPRFWIPDWDGEKFSRWLRRWIRN
jgi:peptidoglycan/xylan/chitin deacetylase (PgdA/CDA1 family)